jgi:hypothetical protein
MQISGLARKNLAVVRQVSYYQRFRNSSAKVAPRNRLSALICAHLRLSAG